MAGFPSAFICFVFDTGLFVVVFSLITPYFMRSRQSVSMLTMSQLLDGRGSCPQTTARPSCVQSGSSIIDTWAGTVMPVPSGTPCLPSHIPNGTPCLSMFESFPLPLFSITLPPRRNIPGIYIHRALHQVCCVTPSLHSSVMFSSACLHVLHTKIHFLGRRN